MTLKLGLTGSIASGKSTLLKAFAALGVPVFSADDAVHQLYQGEAVGPVGEAFPGVVRDGRDTWVRIRSADRNSFLKKPYLQ